MTAPTTLPATARRVPHRTASTVLALAVPLVLTVATVVVALSWRGDLPDPVAVHWGADGPDGSGTLDGFVLTSAVAAAVLAAGGWALAFFAGHAATTRRLGTGFSLGFAGFMGTLVLGTLWLQRGISDWTAAPAVDGVVLLTMLAGLVLGALGAVLTPGDAPAPTTARVPADAARIPLGTGERAGWVQHIRSRGVLVVAAAVAVPVLLVAVAVRTPAIVVPAVLVLSLLVASMASFTVTVDARGLAVRSGLGWPRQTVPLDEVLRAEVVQVRPFHDFGGWGYRVGRGGRVGIVVRTGEGLLVERTGGRSLVVTVDDAATAAALLNTLADRSRVA
jgi:hypothetical protein